MASHPTSSLLLPEKAQERLYIGRYIHKTRYNEHKPACTSWCLVVGSRRRSANVSASGAAPGGNLGDAQLARFANRDGCKLLTNVPPFQAMDTLDQELLSTTIWRQLGGKTCGGSAGIPWLASFSNARQPLFIEHSHPLGVHERCEDRCQRFCDNVTA